MATARLDLELRESGQYTPDRFRTLCEFAKELQAVSIRSQAEILEAEAMALQMGAAVQHVGSLVRAAIKRAAATNVDLQTAIRYPEEREGT